MRTLQTAERVCTAVAILISIPTLAALTGLGENTNPSLMPALLAVVFLLMYISSRLRKRIFEMKADAHNRLPVNAVKARVIKCASDTDIVQAAKAA